jgi:oxygen-independent coproporphyrinogen-3 oxidase
LPPSICEKRRKLKLAASGAAGGGLYVHLPFCPYVCPYCDFAKWPLRRSQAQEYLRCLAAELGAAPAFAARTLFLGGGTPNTYEPADVAALVARARGRFAPDGFAETTIEMNPDAALCASGVFETYRAAGIDRISFGVQSFVAEELETLGRRHAGEDVTNAVRRARAAGIENISLDLIFGTPGQTADSWRTSLAAALALEPAHVSTYGLTVEEGTPYARWYASRPQDFAGNDLEAELYDVAIDTLTGAGFEHYEISNFARPGRRCEHNANYWQNGEYLGLGVGAASYRDGARSVHGRDLAAYLAAAGAGLPIPSDAERLAGAAQFGEATMLLLRTAEGVDVAAFAKRYGVDFHSFYRPVLDDMHATGTLDVTPARVRLTRRGRFVANDVCGAFVTFAS